MLAIIILIVGILARVLVHEPNFTPILALALFSGAYLNKRYAIVLPVALMIITDLIIGLHATILFTWGSMALIALIGLLSRERKSLSMVFGASMSAGILFFVLTNFGVWLMTGLYAHNLNGLVNCYTLAIPFFRNTLISTVLYSTVLFGIYEWIAARVKNTRLASVLLTN